MEVAGFPASGAGDVWSAQEFGRRLTFAEAGACPYGVSLRPRSSAQHQSGWRAGLVRKTDVSPLLALCAIQAIESVLQLLRCQLAPSSRTGGRSEHLRPCGKAAIQSLFFGRPRDLAGVAGFNSAGSALRGETSSFTPDSFSSSSTSRFCNWISFSLPIASRIER